jgi:intracellular sulfur oxidation DsrE/DsrF family protein
MKSIVALSCLAVLTIVAIGAHAQSPQPQPYKVVFDLTSSDPIDQQAVLRVIREIHDVNPKTEMEIVMYGRGLDLAVSGKSALASSVKDAMSTAHASFRVCAIAMKNQQVDKSQLLDNVQIVPDGVGELVAKQHAGWGYIKIGH